MTLHRAEWSFLGKVLYEYVLRGLLKQAVKSTNTQFDDRALKLLGNFASVKES